MDELWIVLVLIILAVGAWIGFKFIDNYLKGGKKKPVPKKKEEKKEEKPESPVVVETPTQQSTSVEAGPNLADEMEKALMSNQPQATSQDRIRTGHGRSIRSFDRMAKYRDAKGYGNFKYDVDDGDDSDEVVQDNIKLTREDYTKIVALGNIDTPK